MAKDLRARVARGAVHLDQIFPDWYTRIDVDSLRMQNCERCVLSQAFDMIYARAVSRAKVVNDWWSKDGVVALGFHLAPDEQLGSGFEQLRDAWIDEIAARVCRRLDIVEESAPCGVLSLQSQGQRHA